MRALTLHVQGEPFALLGLTTPAVAVNMAGLIAYLARRARARRIPYLVVSNLRDAWLLPVPDRLGDLPQTLNRYPSLFSGCIGTYRGRPVSRPRGE